MRITTATVLALAALLAPACSGDAGTADNPGTDATVDGGASSSDDGAGTGDAAGGDATAIADAVTDASDEEACWWCTDASDADVPDTLQGTGTDDGKGELLTYTLEGTLNVDTAEGQLRTIVTDPTTEAVLCDMTQDTTEALVNGTCEACEFAYDMVYGDAVLAVGAEEDCLTDDPLVSALAAGHSPAGEVYFGGKGDGWSAAGTSSFETPTWTFSTSFQFGDGGGKDDGGKDEGCYDACVEKGGSVAECEGFCGDGGKDEG
ncbi:MAG: hypothetical protein QF464_23070, partial [Myxococcota bacterium]|nr:hypothetical protein [Myxococcota bacterium]